MECKKIKSQSIYDALASLYLLVSFGVLDAWLRVMTKEIGMYSILSLEPNMFTVLWAVILTVLITGIPSRKAGRVVYGIVYYLCALYAIIQRGAYLVLGRFLFICDVFYAGEGNDYISYAMNFITPAFVLQIVALCVIGAIGIIFYPKKKHTSDKRKWISIGIISCAILGILGIPQLYVNNVSENAWNTFDDPANEYTRFVNANFDMQLTGMYQYIVKDIGTQIERHIHIQQAGMEEIDAFFAEKTVHENNEMTGLFSGKNVLIVMMESTDDWLIDEQNTPTIYRMMTKGIRFDQFYTPQYSNGYTFNTEFAFNTSIYPYSNGNVAYELVRSQMNHTMANAFKHGGYKTNSFHMGLSSFYNRGVMHQAFGYERYYSYQEFEKLSLEMYDDNFLLTNDELCNLVFPDELFCSFVISYGGHLPYTDEEYFSCYALEKYPQYDVDKEREVNILRAKIRITDDMLSGVLERLEKEGKLEDTVIIGFADHYAYGLTDKERLQQLSEEAGSSILERTPAFIYCAGNELGITVDKVMQITDLAPTIMNLFGLEVPKEIMGQDVFDENYRGYAIFPNNTWLTNEAYMKNGILQWNNGMSDEEIAQMNAYVQKAYVINDKILDTDYYAHKAE